MKGPFDSRHPLVALIDEIGRLHGRLRGMFALAWKEAGLGQSEVMVLNAVVEAERAPTVPQIGRSLGYQRQLVQRAASALVEQGLIETLPNPDHKRALLLRGTETGVAIKRRMDAEADALAEALGEGTYLEDARAATTLLRALRKELETRLRAAER